MNVAVPANVLSLCAGGGGLDLGLRLAVPDARTVCYVENEVTACGVLVSNMEAERLDPAPIWTDLLTFDGKPWRGVVDWVIGGYPCQPFSNAGKRLGADDPRHLWPHVARIVADVAPRFCFFENVGAHLRLGFREVARDLQGMGYAVAATLSTASEVGAPHGRERLFILAYRGCCGRGTCAVHASGGGGEEGAGRAGERCAAVAYSSGERRQQDSRGAHGDEGTDEGWPTQYAYLASGSKSDVADTERSSGSSEPREQHQARAEVTTGSGAVGDSDSGRWDGRTDAAECSPTCGGRGPLAQSGCSTVGDTHLSGLEGWQRSVLGRGYELPAWPPGPTDTDAWRRVLELRPDLAPAIEHPVRGVADGMAGGLGRADQLHILGNGVVPQQAAYSLQLLLAELNRY